MGAFSRSMAVLVEYGMKWRILCSGECNIRVDLLVLHPAPAALSGLAIILAVWPSGWARG